MTSQNMKLALRKTLHIVLLMVMFGALDSRAASPPPTTRLQAIEILADANANQNHATSFDLVFVYNAEAMGAMPRTGPEWFQKKAAVVSNLARVIDVVSLRIPPGSTIHLPENSSFPARYGKAIGVYGYANYLAPGGQAVLNLAPYDGVSIRLSPSAITVQENSPRQRQ